MIAPDMATMLAFRLHRRRGRRRGSCRRWSPRQPTRTFNCITVDGDTSTWTRCSWPPPAGRRMPPIASADDPRAAPSRAALHGVCATSRTRSCATARARPSSSRSRVTGAATDDDARKVAPVDRQLAAGQDRDRRRGPELGPHRDGRRQVRRARRPRPALDPLRRHPGRRAAAGSRPATPRPPARPT